MEDIINNLADKYQLSKKSLAYDYMLFKTQAFNKGSKARRSLGNLYALYVICEDYTNDKFDGSSFAKLMVRMKELPFGSKLQNHPLDNRLNGEVQKRYHVAESLLPVVSLGTGREKVRKISTEFLCHDNSEPLDCANFILEVIKLYVAEIENNQNSYLIDIENAHTQDEVLALIQDAFKYESDARLFEIVSHAILYIDYKSQSVYIGKTPDKLEKCSLTLYKTGRTNANDGGIDFVLQPQGRFYQVTETLDFKKYFLDLDKMNRFPLSFVIKTELSPNEVEMKIYNDAKIKLGTSALNNYMNLFEEIITIPKLNVILHNIIKSPKGTSELKEIIINSFKLEFGMLD